MNAKNKYSPKKQGFAHRNVTRGKPVFRVAMPEFSLFSMSIMLGLSVLSLVLALGRS